MNELFTLLNISKTSRSVEHGVRTIKPKNTNDIYVLVWGCAGATLTRVNDGAEISSHHPGIEGVAHLDAKKRVAFGANFHTLEVLD